MFRVYGVLGKRKEDESLGGDLLLGKGWVFFVVFYCVLVVLGFFEMLVENIDFWVLGVFVLVKERGGIRKERACV